VKNKGDGPDIRRELFWRIERKGGGEIRDERKDHRHKGLKKFPPRKKKRPRGLGKRKKNEGGGLCHEETKTNGAQKKTRKAKKKKEKPV